MAKQKWYVVWEGKVPGIYSTWAQCEAQVKGVSGARFKSFGSETEALEAYKGDSTTEANTDCASVDVDQDSISVDAACSGNPGVLEFRGVSTANGAVIFNRGPFPCGTNNIGEFLAVVEALQLCEDNKTPKTIYTDSITALAWVRDVKVSTNLPRNMKTESLWKLIDEQLEWLRNNKYQSRVVKWDTKKLGEIKADFGRK